MRHNSVSGPVRPHRSREQTAPPAAAARQALREAPALAEPEVLADEAPRNRKAVYTIIEQGGGKSPRWVRIGIAFVNRDGSYNVVLDALPVNATLHIREFPPRGPREEESDL